MNLQRIGWTGFALLPVAMLAFHFGPGQRAWNEDLAARVLERAQAAQDLALRKQADAYDAHLLAITARAAAFADSTAELTQTAKHARDAEDLAYAAAATAWQETASVLSEAQLLLDASTPLLKDRVRLAHARALVRAGEIGAGANDLEDLLDALQASNESIDASPVTGATNEAAIHERTSRAALATAAREELATAYYYGARLMRLAGKPAAEWRAVAQRARQNFRYLAEHAAAENGANDGTKDGARATMTNHQLNGELVLNLEQSSLAELYAKARPKDSPTGNGRGLGEPRAGRRGNRPGDKPDKGAGLNGEIGDGW